MANGTTCCSNEHYRLIKLPRNEYMKTQTVKSLNAAPTWNKLNGRAKLISISLSFRGLPDENKCLSWASRLIKMNSKLSIGFVHCITLEEELWPLKNICLTALKVLKNRVHGVPLLPHYWRSGHLCGIHQSDRLLPGTRERPQFKGHDKPSHKSWKHNYSPGIMLLINVCLNSP